jgi:hypothetical protein
MRKNMFINIQRLFQPSTLLLLALLSIALPDRVFGQTNNVRPLILTASSTNVTARYITNLIQVSIPTNIFVDEFRTNWVRRDITNIVALFRTNLFPWTRTNTLVVSRYITNAVTTYRTNLNTITQTNWETVVVNRTNTITKPVTKVVEHTNTLLVEKTLTNFVMAFQTNFARAFRTNYKNLTLTNWETVLVMKTNWISRPVTNVVEIEMPAAPAATTIAIATPAAPARASTEPPITASATALLQGLEFDLTHLGAPEHPGNFPVRLVLLSAGGVPLPVFEWRMEKIDGSALMGGARPEFTGTLPAGTYKVVARIRVNDGSIRTIRGSTEVKADASTVRTSATGPTVSTASR